MICFVFCYSTVKVAVLFSRPYIDNITLNWPIVHVKETLKSNISCCNIYTLNAKNKSITFATVVGIRLLVDGKYRALLKVLLWHLDVSKTNLCFNFPSCFRYLDKFKTLK